MARNGWLPKKLINCCVLMCAACQDGKLMKVPWRSKDKRTSLQMVTRPGQVVVVDQLELNMQGLIVE